jgi:hypothetical protein
MIRPGRVTGGDGRESTIGHWHRRLASNAQALHAPRGLGGYEREMRGFLDYVLEAYEKHGADELASRKIADFLRIRYGGTNDAKRLLGPVPAIREAFIAIQAHLYQ